MPPPENAAWPRSAAFRFGPANRGNALARKRERPRFPLVLAPDRERGGAAPVSAIKLKKRRLKMGYRSSDRSYGEGRWRDRDDERRPQGRGDYGRGNFERGGDDRGFFERARDEVRSLVRRRRSRAAARHGRAALGARARMAAATPTEANGPAAAGATSRGDSWRREPPGEYSGSGDWGSGRRQEIFGDDRFPGGTSGFGGYPDLGRRFDRIDPGSVGTHAAHPMSSPAGTGFGGGYSSARSAAILAGGIPRPALFGMARPADRRARPRL